MSVFTRVTRSALAEFLADYDVGELENFHGISEGVENTNYFVDTSGSGGSPTRFVLTLFERLDDAQLPYFLGLMRHVHEAGVPTAAPIVRRDGSMLGTLMGKTAALVERIDGIGVADPSSAQCAATGAAMAQLHAAGKHFAMQRPADRGLDWCQRTAAQVMPRLEADAASLLRDELTFQTTVAAVDRGALPHGIIHADLFRDNTLFLGDRLVGMIDFYYACNDRLLYDLAVSTNDWCLNTDFSPHEARWRALLDAYAAQRPFTDAEQDCWVAELRLSALRFWLSRLYDLHFPRGGDLALIKDPQPQRIRLERWRAGEALPLA